MRNRIGMRWREISRDRWAFGGWAVLGLGLLLLTVSIPFSIWLIQRSGEAGPGLTGSGTISTEGSIRDTASFSDSAKLEIRRAPTADSVENQPTAAATGEAGLISAGDEEDSGQDLPAGEVATLSDTAILEVQRVPTANPDDTEPPGGGAVGATNFSDSAQFVVRDSEGNIKEQGVTK